MTDRLRSFFNLKNADFRFCRDPVRLADLVLPSRFRRRRRTRLAGLADRADAASALHVQRRGISIPQLPRVVNHLLVALYIGIAFFAFWHFWWEFEEIAIYRQGSYTQRDFIVGLGMFLLVMELTRLAHPVLFWTNIVLVVYTMYGYLSPIDFFWHPGTTFYRVVTSSTVEMSTGIYGIYGQLALTLIAAFLLLAGVANGFNAQNAMINVVRLIARSRRLIPQTAVVGSSAIGLISGSGSANAAVVGTITIPLMVRYGVPPTFAAAVETAASMGGLIDPPMMGAAAFLMAEFLGVPYWEVVLRGFGFSFIYYISIAFAVYLLCVRLLPGDRIEKPIVPVYDKVCTIIFLSAVLYLLYLMGFAGTGELRAALFHRGLHDHSAHRRLPLLQACPQGADTRERDVVRQLPARDRDARRDDVISDAAARDARHHDRFVHRHRIHRPDGIDAARSRRLEHHGHDLHGLGLRLASRCGLPPTATYIIGAVIIVPPMMKLGIDPWVAHFFVFFLSVWGELSPPTSLTAAVSARIANTSFMRTMYEALKICAPITLMTFAIFTRSDLVLKPGWGQIIDVLVVTSGTCGVAFAMFGQFFRNVGADLLARVAIAALSFVTLFHPDDRLVWATATIGVVAMVWGVSRHLLLAPSHTVVAAPAPDLPEPRMGAARNLASEG